MTTKQKTESLEQALKIICKIDNQHPGNKDIQKLYDLIQKIKKQETNY